MFSPEASVQSVRTSLRGTRRRQRDSSGHDQQPRRKRNKLTEDGASSATSGAHANTNGDTITNGHVAPDNVEHSPVLMDIPVREKKAQQKRAPKEDTAQYLTKNANYTIKRLRGFPTSLTKASIPFTGSALSSASLALTVTHTQASVWDYNCNPANPPKIVTLPLKFGLRSSDPLPLGAIVQNGPTNDFGVIVVAPSTGKITFWDNIDSVETRGLYQRQQGTEGSVKLYHGEVVTDLVNIEHAGYILNLSSGRLAQLTLRDPQGRPNVTATVLNSPNGSGGSFFSFKGLLGGATRKTISAVKARPSESKGQMEVISTTRNGIFETWDLSWSGQQIFKQQFDVCDEMLSTVQTGIAPEVRGQHELHVLDFEIMQSQQSTESVGLLVLVALSGRSMLDYTLLEVDLSTAGSAVTRAIPIRDFYQPELPKGEPTGTLLLPQPGHTAFAYLPGAVVVASLAQPEESPEAQLLADAGAVDRPFQDIVYFRSDLCVVLSGFALELPKGKDRTATALMFIQGYGIVQVSAQPPTSDANDKERSRPTARSKLEQATFFNTVPRNILDFSIKSRFSFSEEETVKAALAVSKNIMNSSYEHLDKVTSSMDDHFGQRALALRNLINHLQADYPSLPFKTKWTLLWSAEKLAASHAVWNWYEAKLQDQKTHPEAYPESILMGDIVKALHERYKTPLKPDHGEKDSIRNFFLRDPEQIGLLLPWGFAWLRAFYLKEGNDKDVPSTMQRLSESTDVVLVALQTAFEFRQANIEAYGLDPDSLEDGILRPGFGYDMLPNFWTSSHNNVCSIRSLVDVGRNIAEENYEEGTWEALSQKIGRDNARLVKMECQTHIERFQWALEQSDEKLVETGRSLRDEWNVNVRPKHIIGLMEIGLPNEGMALAEQYHDMPTLVNLIWEESRWLESTKQEARSKMEQAEVTVKLNKIKDRINRYFATYGDEWADAFYSKHITEGKSAAIFTKEYLNQAALTKFLRADPSRARLAWLNEVHGERNYEGAAEALYEAAAKQETNIWCQQVELSMAKLAMLSTKEAKDGEYSQPADGYTREQSRSEKARESFSKTASNQIQYGRIQEMVYEEISPMIKGALDDDSALELLMARYGQGRLTERPAHQMILKEGFEALIHHRVIDPALMVDILTLMNDNGSGMEEDEESPHVLDGNEFSWALRALVLNWNIIHRTTRDGLLRLVWKRLCLKDDWASINQSKDVSDASIDETLLKTAVGWTFMNLLTMREEDYTAEFVYPKEAEALIGAGGTHGELCVRFSSEDLREPIIKDNLLDDEQLRENIEKHRMSEWYGRTLKAARQAFEARKIRKALEQADETPAETEVAGVAAEGAMGMATGVAAGGETGQAVDMDMAGA